jgi:DNA polymerase
MMAMGDICEWGPVPWRDTGLFAENGAAEHRVAIDAAIYHRRVSNPTERRERLKELYATSRGCVRCPQLAETRRQVVFGAGNADADLMFVGEAPGKHEDEQGLPFVGQAGKLLDQLLEEVGLARGDVFVCNVLKCRPPGNRDPHPVEIDNCQGYLFDQVAYVRPKVVCTLGNFATKLLRGDQTGVTRVHGREELLVIGTRAVRLYPLYHPAAALYTRAMLDVLRADFARIPDLLALPEPEQPAPGASPEPAVPEPEIAAEPGREPVPEPPAAPEREAEPAPVAAPQLGLF